MAAILEGLEPLGLPVVATVGHDLDPAALGTRGPSVRVTRYVPMTSLLEEASVLVFHGGSGTMLAGLAAGLPLVILPVAADQPENAERCVAAGVARVLPPDDRGPASVRDAVTEVVENPAYRMAAERVRRQIEAMPVPAAVLGDLEMMVDRG
jgi:UDP:flavonoid glycosyltransferase YjiC (YdhE family)